MISKGRRSLDFKYSYSPAQRRRSRQKSIPKGGYFAVAIFLGLGGWWMLNTTTRNNSPEKQAAPSQASPTTSSSSQVRALSVPTQTTSPSNQSTPAPSPTAKAASVQAAIEAVVEAHPEMIIGVSFTNLKNGEKAQVNAEEVFTAASTTKMIPAVLFLSKVEEGTYSLNGPLGGSTTQYHLKQMINQSNNTSWAHFNQLLTFAGEQEFAQKIGAVGYQWQGNKFTAAGMNHLLTRLYKGELLNQQHTNLLLSYMENTNEESFIPSALPDDAIVYHKYGILEDNVHDGAIVKNGSDTFIVAIYTNGRGFYSYDKRAVVFAEIVGAILKSM